MTNYGKTLIEVNECTRRLDSWGKTEPQYQTIKVGDECKVGHFGGFRGTFFGEPAKIIKIQKDEFGGHRICVQGQKSGYKVYCKESGLVSTTRFGKYVSVQFKPMDEKDILSYLYDFNK